MIENEDIAVSEPVGKKKKPAAAKKTKRAPLKQANANLGVGAEDDLQTDKDGKTIEQMYQKLSQLEHILLRPDTYIGSIERQQQPMWVLSSEGEKIEHKDINFVPGLYKIFDEILVNACDHRVRDATMNALRVDFDKENGSIRVYNNGRGIPVEVHKTE